MQHWVMRQVELQRRDGDVFVAEAGNIRVFLRFSESEDAAVPEVKPAAWVAAFFVGILPAASALAGNADTGWLFLGKQRRNVHRRDLSAAQPRLLDQFDRLSRQDSRPRIVCGNFVAQVE